MKVSLTSRGWTQPARVRCCAQVTRTTRLSDAINLVHRSYGLWMALSYEVVCSFVRASATKCTIMYNEQTAGSRSANFCILRQVDNVPSPNNFHPNPLRPWRSISRSKIRIEYIGKCKRGKRSVCRHSEMGSRQIFVDLFEYLTRRRTCYRHWLGRLTAALVGLDNAPTIDGDLRCCSQVRASRGLELGRAAFERRRATLEVGKRPWNFHWKFRGIRREAAEIDRAGVEKVLADQGRGAEPRVV